LTTLTDRQFRILGAVFAQETPNLRAIADELGSPNRLKANLDELVQKGLLNQSRKGKQEFIYTITKAGIRLLQKYEVDNFTASVDRLTSIFLDSPDAEAKFNQLARMVMEKFRYKSIENPKIGQLHIRYDFHPIIEVAEMKENPAKLERFLQTYATAINQGLITPEKLNAYVRSYIEPNCVG